jgi:FixJ family two-component response regulator
MDGRGAAFLFLNFNCARDIAPAPEAVVQVRRERVTDFLPGPFRQAELLAAILKAIAAQKSAPAGAPQGTHAS